MRSFGCSLSSRSRAVFLCAMVMATGTAGCSGVSLNLDAYDDGGSGGVDDGSVVGDGRSSIGMGAAADSGLDGDAPAVVRGDGASDGRRSDDGFAEIASDATSGDAASVDATAPMGTDAASDDESAVDASVAVASDATADEESSGDASADEANVDATPSAPVSPCAGPTPVACVNPMTGANDFCSNGGDCAACTDTTDDSHCTTAYGGATGGAAGGASSGASYLCLSGVCALGDCRTDGDCAGNPEGPLCGVSVPNFCGKCPAVTVGNFEVDPDRGSDSVGTGDGTTARCALKTIARALALVGRPRVATTITVLGPSIVQASETFPIVLPTLVTVTTSGGGVTVNVPAGAVGFSLAAPSSNISGTASAPLTIRGQGNTASYGIVATTGSQSSTQIGNLTVTGFLEDGILVEKGGILSIGPGVTSTLNGTAAARKAGLHVTGTGEALVTVPLGSAPTHFDQNSNHGIFVEANGFVELEGVVTSASAGTITTNGNYAAGIWIAQAAGTPPQNVIEGVVSFGATSGNGMHFVSGSNVRVRDSASLGNQASGILVSGAVASCDISAIDLGNPKGRDYGNNTLQEPLGAANNGSAGICLDVGANSGTLLGAGNIFGDADCATAASALTMNKAGCGNNGCVGVCDVGVTAPGNDVNVSKCTHP